MAGTRTPDAMNSGHCGKAAVYAAKALEPATAPEKLRNRVARALNVVRTRVGDRMIADE